MSAHDILALCACSACPSMLLEMDQLYDLLKQRMAENRDKILQDRMATREEERRAHIVRLAAWDQNRVGEKPKLVLTSVGFSRKDSAAIIVPAADNAFSQVYLNRAVYKVRVYLHIFALLCVGQHPLHNFARRNAAAAAATPSACGLLVFSCCCARSPASAPARAIAAARRRHISGSPLLTVFVVQCRRLRIELRSA